MDSFGFAFQVSGSILGPLTRFLGKHFLPADLSVSPAPGQFNSASLFNFDLYSEGELIRKESERGLAFRVKAKSQENKLKQEVGESCLLLE